jgi:general secretion pathway protein J
VNKSACQQGFTLIELLIAIVLTAIIATMAYQSLESASNGSKRTREVLNDINKLDKAWQLIGQDMRNIILPPLPGAAVPAPAPGATNPTLVGANGGVKTAPVKGAPKAPPPVLEGAPSLMEQTFFQAASLESQGKDSFQIIMQFARRGWVNPMGRLRSDLQQVNYRIAEGQLIRDYLPERNKKREDIDFEKEALHQVLLDNVTDIQLRFLSDAYLKANGASALKGENYSENWDTLWPPINPDGAAGNLVAVEITLEVTADDNDSNGKKNQKEKKGSRSVRLYEFPH